ncbi:MAG: hypothetical protein M1819_001841 [Sarea resinae]|nr:MAG: hypothetical protein M1819_001841 [Sarea resinae]
MSGGGLGTMKTDSPETSRLLYDDQYQHHYGAANTTTPHGESQADQQDIKREREALERVCLQTSDKLIDIFTTQQQPTDASSAAESKSSRYHRLLDKSLRTDSKSHPKPSQLPPSSSSSKTAAAIATSSSDERAWLNSMAAAAGPAESANVDEWRAVNRADVAELVGNFTAPAKGKRAIRDLKMI